jgi:hypothetical protein
LYTQVAKTYDTKLSIDAEAPRSIPTTRARPPLHQQRESELIQHIKLVTERRFPPKKAIMRIIASWLGREVSDLWVTRFINRNSSHLIIRWQTGMDRNCHKADSEAKYSLSFDLLHGKIKDYDLLPEHIFNMHEKGFMIGVTGRSKKVFDKKVFKSKGATAAVKDGNREWVTVIACVCSDGEAYELLEPVEQSPNAA